MYKHVRLSDRQMGCKPEQEDWDLEIEAMENKENQMPPDHQLQRPSEVTVPWVKEIADFMRADLSWQHYMTKQLPVSGLSDQKLLELYLQVTLWGPPGEFMRRRLMREDKHTPSG